MTTNWNWRTCTNNENFTIKTKKLLGVQVVDHPLKNVIVTERIPRRILGSQPSTGRTTPVSTPTLEPLTKALEGIDPLTAFAIEEMDPLSKMAAEEVENKGRRDSFQFKKHSNNKPKFESWQARKAAILSKFTTSEKISIVTSFLSEGEKVIVKAQSTAVDKVQHRLEQLDYFEEGSQRKLDLSQTEYVTRIEQLNKELVSAWHSEQRVKSLKIAIQCAKLLADTNVLSFYPSKFVLITDILDIFGHLVYNRLRTKADYYKPGTKVATALPEDFTPDMVPDSARETCLNWFYKIASIRELVPRLYVEMALLKSYGFLSTNECQEALLRLTQMISGIGNPLVAVYARCYLCRVGLNAASPTMGSQYLLTNFNEFLNSYHHIFSKHIQETVASQSISLSVYMTLFTPALDYMLQAVAYDASDALINNLLEKCRTHGSSSLILNTIMSAFKPSFIANRTLQFLEMIDNCMDEGIPRHLLLRTLGLCVSISSPPSDERRILNSAWRHISPLKDSEEYITCAEAWVPFVVQNFSNNEINTLLEDIIEHLSPNRSYELYSAQLKHIVENIVLHTQDFEALLMMDNFLPLIDLFREESVRLEVSKSILTSFSNEYQISDPVMVNSLKFLCGILHESVSAMLPEDEYKQIGAILSRIVKMIDYGRDFEQQLSFYVEARGMFSNVDIVFIQLVQCVNTLSVNTRQIIKGLHTRKTADFVRACAAYCFITIPSIKSIRTRLKLYLLSGQVALFNQCLGQADACFKAALSTLTDLREEKGDMTESELMSYIKQFLSVLLVVPDNPDCGVLSLTKSLLNIVGAHTWETNGSLTSIYLNALSMLSMMAQEEYLYHIDKVDSNDTLYGSNSIFLTEINNLCCVIIGEILSQLQLLGACQKQSYFASDLFLKIVTRSDLNPQLSQLALKLWRLSMKNEKADVKFMARTKSYLRKKAEFATNTNLHDLLDKLQE